MSGRIPADAFQYYVGLGPNRSYQAVAQHFGVTKRAVTKRAGKEGWSSRLEAIERKARAKNDEQLVDVVAEMNERHLKTLKVIQGKALEALRAMPLTRAFEAVRALDMAIRSERVIHGEPTERTSSTLEDLIKGEYTRWMATEGEDADDWDDDEEGTGTSPAAGESDA